MWSFFSRDPAKDFHYEIGEKIAGLEDKTIWMLHRGKKKSSGEPVSVFAFDVKGMSEAQVQTAKTSLKRIKTLRHPNILTFLDAVETDKVIYFATEPVIPLETYLRDHDSEGHNEVAISWGLHQIVKGLSFLVNDCNLIHNNVCMASIYVDPAGEWKLAGVDYMYPAQGADSVPPPKILPLLERYNSPERMDGRKIRSEKWSADMWGLGCLIWEVFNGTLPSTAALKSPGKIPSNLVSNYCELVGANPRSRPNPAKFIENCRKKDGFMCNTFVDSMMFLEEIQIKDQEEKNRFLASLTPSLDSFPVQFCLHKILPQLLNAFEYSNAGSSVLPPMFKIGKFLDSAEYQAKIVPCVVKLFSSPDRATRVKLLQQIETFIEHLQPGTVNDQIFPNVISGLVDTNPMVRESTIKAMLHLAPKLNYKNLNEELMKQFARLQTKDDQGGIRTNTTVCLGKIACFINPSIRQKILCSAFMRAMKDPFPPARQAGILGIAATQNFYHLSEIATRLLPALCAISRDPDKAVRDQAFKAIKGFISKLEKVSESPELEEEFEREVMSGSASGASTTGWAGWAATGMSSLTSKIYSRTPAKSPQGLAKASMAPASGNRPTPKQASTSRESTPVTESKPSMQVKVDDADDDDEEEYDDDEECDNEEKKNMYEAGDGWEEEDWGDLDTNQFSKADKDAKEDEGWDDDDWGSLEDTALPQKMSSSQPANFGQREKSPVAEFVSTKSSGLPSTDSYNWGTQGNKDDDFFSSIADPDKSRSKSNNRASEFQSRNSPARSIRSSKPHSSPQTLREKSTEKKEEMKDEEGDSALQDLDSWGGDTWGDMGDFGSGETQAEKMKREKAEKREQRQKELQEKREARKAGGAMKLGAKKIGLS